MFKFVLKTTKLGFATCCAIAFLALPATANNPKVINIEQPTFAVDKDKVPDTHLFMQNVSNVLQKQLSAKFKLKRRSRRSKNIKRTRGTLFQFYADRDFAPVWISKDGLHDRTQQLLVLFQSADEYGLNPQKYKLRRIQDFLVSEPSDLSASDVAKAEIELSTTFLKYVGHVRDGRIVPSEISRFMEGTKEKPLTTDDIEDIVFSKNITKKLDSLHPDHPQYRLLLAALADLKDKSKKRQENSIPLSGPVLKEGDIHPHIAIIRKKLKVPAPLTEDGLGTEPQLFDFELSEEIKSYQRRAGLRPDAILGPRTRRALNVSAKGKYWQIMSNIERWRWLPNKMGNLYIQSNIPEFQFRMVQNNKIVHQERVIVGKIKHKTPVFSDELEKVVFNPYWNVPQSIIANEMNYSVPRGYEGRRSGGLLHVRQPPGPSNALGKVKFLFPNKHAVYMHDTPTKALFNQEVRAFSHGCMRVRDPRRLAEVVLAKASEWTNGDINRIWSTLNNKQVELSRKIPVHVTYFTAWADENGLKYFNDIYQHDKRVATVLKGGRVYLEPKQTIKPRIRRKPKSFYDEYFYGDPYYSTQRRRKRKKTYGYAGNNGYQNNRKRKYRKKKPKTYNFFSDIF